MASTINASNSGFGGIVSTGDSSGQLALQAAGTTAVTINTSGAIGVGSTPSYGTSGQLLTSAGSSAAPTWTTVSSGGMTLLGTLTTTSGTTQTLSGLTLTNYKQIQIVGSAVSTNGTGGVLVSPNSQRLTNDMSSASDTANFFTTIDLATGVYTSSYVFNDGSPVAPYVRNSGLSTAATSITLSLTNSASFDAGTVKIYGVA